MMKLMGWNEGEGLGKEGEGQKTHIQLKRRPDNLGICYLFDFIQV